MHFLNHVTPLLVRSLVQSPMTYALLPVPLAVRPSSNPQSLSLFVKAGGERVALHEDDALRVRNYMKRHNTEALTSDGCVAFTLQGNQLLECDPQSCGQPPERLQVRFHPLCWIGGTAQPDGPPEFVDVTDLVLALPAEAIPSLRDSSVAADALVDPQLRGHLGPYTVHCEEAICRFFGVTRIAAVTPDVFAAKQIGRPAAPLRVLPLDLEGGSVWMLGVSQDNAHYTCRADDIEQALQQCREAFPGRSVTSACSVA